MILRDVLIDNISLFKSNDQFTQLQENVYEFEDNFSEKYLQNHTLNCLPMFWTYLCISAVTLKM